MDVKVKKQNSDGMVRLETQGIIKEILINEDFANPGKESVSLCFRGKNSSGIVTLSTQEVEFLASKIKPNLHLIKKSKVIISPKE
ncbi:MAG: hypothetical protein Q8Q31_03020 [Nanoarchaeota archaeon]|nr:hypothetical protein [Nanoarchaeota archaeon]